MSDPRVPITYTNYSGPLVSDSDKKDATPSPVEPASTASTSAVSLQDPSGQASSGSGLRERTRTPYSTTVKDEDEPERIEVGAATSSKPDKGKQREQPLSEAKDNGDEQQESEKENPFACNICLEVPESGDCVTTKCGHLFCWSDLSAWLDSAPPRTSMCPVCKSEIKDVQEDVIPIYSGSNSGTRKEVDPRTKPRPKPRVNPAAAATSTRGAGLFGGGAFAPLWDAGTASTGGWTINAGVFPFPGLSFGYSNVRPAPTHFLGAGGPFEQPVRNGVPQGMTQEQATEQARIQQRNAIVGFVIMLLLFTLFATIGEVEEW